MNTNAWIARSLIVVVAMTLCGAPELAQAQSGTQPQQQTQPPTQPNGGMVDPSRGPLAPVPAPPLPDAPSSTPTDANAPLPPQEQQPQQPQNKTEQPIVGSLG